MSTIGNILWFLFGGLIGGLAWVLAGCLWCITIIASSAYPLACNASNSQVSPFSRLGKKLCMAVEAFPSSST